MSGWESYWEGAALPGHLLKETAQQIFDAFKERVDCVIERRHDAFLTASLSTTDWVRPEVGMSLNAKKGWFGPYGMEGQSGFDFFTSFYFIVNTQKLSWGGGGAGIASAFMLRTQTGEVNEWVCGHSAADFENEGILIHATPVVRQLMNIYGILNNMRYIVTPDQMSIIDGEFLFQGDL